jgi:hypothetical protein
MLMARVITEGQSLANQNNQLWADDNFPSVSSDWTFTALNSIVKLTNIITPTVVNEFQFGYTENFIHFQTSSVSDPNLASRAGFADLLTGDLAQYQEEETLNPVYDRWHDYALYL